MLGNVKKNSLLEKFVFDQIQLWWLGVVGFFIVRGDEICFVPWIKEGCYIQKWERSLSSYLDFRRCRISSLRSHVSGRSSSLQASSTSDRQCKIGFTALIVTYLLPDNTSVNSLSWASAALMHSRTSRSCQLGTRWDAFLSFLSTLLMAFLFRKTRLIICCGDPQRVGHSFKNQHQHVINNAKVSSKLYDIPPV